ncbi:LysR family transcriptional regulator [Vibrio sp. SCSIO 43137]|uniref:LysR family transcriptional regulator n=1 Tax=Vibrio sp. SCSIO 43137 TaxID=3021011 RepID=UPI002307C84A|nr:LysR family transcriptional regulator [Vibrio sp. SCSIO 43137]WCE29331.1 LysR family transcriptional regulator [Vibrio sp. SCSIO 43137]
MDLATRLEMLLEVAEHGSFAKAADARGIDRSVLSKQIKKLEESLGLRLLNRSTRSLSLTNAGGEIVKQAEKVRMLLDETRQLADTFHTEPKGHIRVSASTQFGRNYLQKAAEIFLEKYPKVTIELFLDDRKVDIIGERFDLVFRLGQPADSNLIARKLADHGLVLLASDTFIAKYGYPATPEQLAELPAVVYSNGVFTANKIQLIPNSDDGRPYNLTKKERYISNEAEILLKGVRAGLGYAVVSQLMLDRSIEELGLVNLLPDYHIAYEGGLYALYPHRNQPPLVKNFIDTVQEVIGTPPVWEQF